MCVTVAARYQVSIGPHRGGAKGARCPKFRSMKKSAFSIHLIMDASVLDGVSSPSVTHLTASLISLEFRKQLTRRVRGP